MFSSRLKVVMDSGMTASDLLDKMSIMAAEREVFRFDEDFRHYGLSTQSLTIGELRAVVNRMSNALAAAGIRRYDRIAIWKANSLDYFLLSMAVIRLGGIAVPINGGMTPGDLNNYLAKVGARALCLDQAGHAKLQAAGGETAAMLLLTGSSDGLPNGTVDLAAAVRAASPEGDGAAIPRDADVLICHTSGTTGFPKGVLHGSESLIRAVRGQLKIQPITHRNVAMMATPMNHHISISGCMTNVAAGLPMYIAIDSNPETLLRTIERECVNIFFAFPHTYLDLYRYGLERHDLSSVRMWMSGADAMHEIHIREFTRHGAFVRVAGKPVMKSIFMELLGTSEVGIVALMKVSRSSTNLYGRCVGTRTPISPKVKVADETGVPVRAGIVGRLMVKGPTVFKGYWNEHDRAHGTILDGWWWTGDLAFRDRRGRFYQVDRDADCIRTLGGPIYTLLAEEKLLMHPDVHEAVVIGVPAPGGGDKPLVVLQAKHGRNLDREETLRWIISHVPALSACTDLVVVYHDDEIPRGLTGKVLKRVLRNHHASAQTPNGNMLVTGAMIEIGDLR